MMAAMHHQPTGAGYDVVLLLHVACVVSGLATTLATAATATRLRRLLQASVPPPETVRRYFRPGVNWAGRTVYGIPVFGFALLAMSHGAYALGDGWVLAGLVLFAALALVAELVLWPAERRVQSALMVDAPPAGDAAGAKDASSALVADATALVRAASACVALLLAGTIVMIAQP
jgi:hypothetical protein